MDLLHPMIVKEFRRTVPGRELHRTRVKLGSLYALMFLVSWIAGPGAVRQLPSLLLGLPIYAALTSGFRVGSRLLAEELEEGQLEVLLTTPLTRFEVFVAKGVGQLFRGMHPVWMALPIYAFATAVGAFTPEQALLSGLYTIGLWALCVVLGCAATLKGTNSINATLTAGTLFALVSVPPVPGRPARFSFTRSFGRSWSISPSVAIVLLGFPWPCA